jgi:hypothetical protein
MKHQKGEKKYELYKNDIKPQLDYSISNFNDGLTEMNLPLIDETQFIIEER